MKIQKIYDKGSREINEDELLIQDNLFAVFDGATSLIKYVNEKGETGGRLAAKIAKEVFSKNDKPLNGLAEGANDKILEEMKKVGINSNQKESLWSAAVAAIKINKEEIEFFTIADCLILVIFKDGYHKLLVDYFDFDLESMKKWKELANKKVKDIFNILLKDEIELRRQANVKFGVLNGEKEARKFFEFGKIDLKDIKSIILFTDGLLIPKEDPEAPEDWDLFVKLYQEKGLVGILNFVRSLEKTDPLCWKYPRYKQHDDVAAIGIDF